MNTTPPNTVIFVLLSIAAVLAVVTWLILQRQRSVRLKRRFGPQYDLTVSEFHGRTAETELLDVRNASTD